MNTKNEEKNEREALQVWETVLITLTGSILAFVIYFHC